MALQYGEKNIKEYDLTPGNWDKVGTGLLLTKIEFWAFQYDISFQMWGPGNNNAFINKFNVELAIFGGCGTAKQMFEKVVKWCEKSNPRIKYPEAIIGEKIDLPD